jgi:hypothetical protein
MASAKGEEKKEEAASLGALKIEYNEFSEVRGRAT